MPPKASPTDFPIRPFPSRADFEAFLEKEHATAPGVYVKFAKKASGIRSILPTEAVEAALCFGWIDGRANSIDETWWTVRYTPRTKKSMWSQKNVNTITRLLDEGRVRPAGIAAVDAAKADGRWERAYAGPATITVPEDLAAEMAAQPAALAFFEGLNKGDRYSVLHRVETASPKARSQRIKMLVEQLSVGLVPGIAAAPSTKLRKEVGPRKKPVKDAVPKKEPQDTKLKRKGSGVDVKPPVQPRREGLRRRT